MDMKALPLRFVASLNWEFPSPHGLAGRSEKHRRLAGHLARKGFRFVRNPPEGVTFLREARLRGYDTDFKLAGFSWNSVG